MKNIIVSAAIIVQNNKILCVQRGANKLEYISEKWEFPGGKVEPDEQFSDTAVREIREELNMDITVDKQYITVNHQYPDFHLTMHTFLCSCKNNSPTFSEHIDYKWLPTSELGSLDWAAADIPVVDKLIIDGK